MAKNKHYKKKSEAKIGKTILHDIRHENIPRSLSKEFKDIYNFYIDFDIRRKLYQMGRFRRWIRVAWWILKSMFFKLTPVRRILLIVGLALSFSLVNELNNKFIFGIAIIVLVLMLELKDKLLAKDELMIGRAVQSSLLPEENPEIHGWKVWLYTHPANEVGGDLVDYIKLNETQWGLVLADVAGKGLGAALLMAKLQATLRAIAPNFKSLTKLGKELNAIFCRDGLPNRFISLIYMIVAENSGDTKILNAGHLPPFISSGNQILEMQQGDVAIGIRRDATYRHQQIKFDSGDIIIFFSDGITEARNKKAEFFAEQRLKEILKQNRQYSAENIGKKIITAVEQFKGDEPPTDDLSLIVLKRV